MAGKEDSPASLSRDAVAALARRAGIELPADDLDPLIVALDRYTEICAPLHAGELDVENATNDPRVGW